MAPSLGESDLLRLSMHLLMNSNKQDLQYIPYQASPIPARPGKKRTANGVGLLSGPPQVASRANLAMRTPTRMTPGSNNASPNMRKPAYPSPSTLWPPRPGSVSRPPVNPVEPRPVRPHTAGPTPEVKQRVFVMISALSDKIHAYNPSLTRTFRDFDVSKQGALTRGDFYAMMSKWNLITSAADRATFDAMFREFDEDGNGTIDYNEFARLLKRPDMGTDLIPANARITSASSFAGITAPASTRPATSKELTKYREAFIYRVTTDFNRLTDAFRFFDRSAKGFLLPADIINGAEKFNLPIPRDHMMEMINQAVAQGDTNFDGKIDFKEFAAMCTPHRYTGSM